jgi:hypothetical protein
VCIESVAWERASASAAVDAPRRALIGTSAGVVYEARVDKSTRTVEQVFDLSDRVPVTAMEIAQWPRMDPPRYCVLLTTPTRLYQFVGAGQSFADLFANYTTVPPNFTELMPDMPPPPPFALPPALQVLAADAEPPRRFAWLTAQGVFHGGLAYRAQKPGDACAVEPKLAPLPAGPADPPLAMVMTEYHVLLLFSGACLRVCRSPPARDRA